MAAVRRDEIAQELTRLRDAVDAAVTSKIAALPAIRSVLTQATAAVEAIGIADGNGGYIVTIPENRRRSYFPNQIEERRTPNSAEIEHADAGWQKRRAAGRRFREEALAYVGTVLTPAETAARLGVSAMTVTNWRRQNKLLGLRFDSHQYLYPAFQFAETPAQGERGVVRDLDRALAALEDRTAWEKAQFLVTPWPYLHGHTPLDILRDGRGDSADREKVIRYARHAGEMGV